VNGDKLFVYFFLRPETDYWRLMGAMLLWLAHHQWLTRYTQLCGLL